MEPQLILAIERWPLEYQEADPENLKNDTCRLFDTDKDCWRTILLEDVSTFYKDTDVENTTGTINAMVLVSSLVVSSSYICIPPKQRRHIDKILPFLCEEKVASDIDDVHIATGDVGADKTPIRVIEKRQLESLIGYLKHFRIRPLQVFCDSDIAPTDKHCFWLDDINACLVSETESITTNANNAIQVIDSWYGSQNSPTLLPLDVYIAQPDVSTELRLSLDQWRSQGAEIAIQTDNKVGELLAESLWYVKYRQASSESKTPDAIGRQCINLLTGSYRVESSKRTDGKFKHVAIAASLFVALNLFYLVASGFYWQAQADKTYQQSEALYREFFPQDRRIVNIKTQVQNHLGQRASSGSDGVLTLLSDFLPSWEPQKHQIELKSLRYHQQRNELLLELDAQSITQLDQLGQALGDRAELLSANENGSDGASGRIKYKGAH